MTDRDDASEGFSLKRWSTRKLAAARAAPSSPASATSPADALPVAMPDATTPVHSSQQPETQVAETAAALPAVESLTFESDFSAFLSPKVAEPLKRQALKKLFSDPRFNVMDGLDVYIDDYSVPSPIEPELIEKLAHARFTLNPPPTRVNAQGFVEDVPPEELAAERVPEAPADKIAASDPDTVPEPGEEPAPARQSDSQ